MEDRLKKVVKFLIVDDSVGACNQVKSLLKHYYKKIGRDYVIQSFHTATDFLINRDNYYDFAIVDWNLASEDGKNGDVVVLNLKGIANNICILSAQTATRGKIVQFANENCVPFFKKEAGHDKKIINWIEGGTF